MSQIMTTWDQLLFFIRNWFSKRNHEEFRRYWSNFFLRMGLMYASVVPIRIFEYVTNVKGETCSLFIVKVFLILVFLIFSACLVYIGSAISLYVPEGGGK